MNLQRSLNKAKVLYRQDLWQFTVNEKQTFLKTVQEQLKEYIKNVQRKFKANLKSMQRKFKALRGVNLKPKTKFYFFASVLCFLSFVSNGNV